MPLVSITTGVMRSIGATTSSMATMRLDATEAGTTAPGGPVIELAPGLLFANRYRIEQILGRGGIGIVYKASDPQLYETVAINTPPRHLVTRLLQQLDRFNRAIGLS